MSERLETPVRRWRALTSRVLAALCLAAALLAPAAAPALGGTPQAQLDISVAPNGFALVTDLTAASGGASGSVSLTWTEPGRSGALAPYSYDVRVSTVGQISNHADFSAAAPLSSFSPTTPPVPGPGGGGAGFVVGGLTPGVTYYFAMEEKDSTLPAPIFGPWLRGTARNWNAGNTATAQWTPNPPNAVTDLTAVSTGTTVNPIGHLSWTAPLNVNGVPIARYVLKYSTISAQAFGGGAENWFANASSTAVLIAPAQAPGTREVTDVTGLPSGVQFYFGVKSYDVQGEVSAIDTKAASLVAQARLALSSDIDAVASSGPVAGSVSLSWIEPPAALLTPPLRYEVRASSVANFNDNAGWAAAQPLTALSPSLPPVPGAGGAQAAMLVTSLTPGVTYYFGVREFDSAGNGTDWIRSPSVPIGMNNFSLPAFVPRAPDAVTDLTALQGTIQGEIALSWTAPRNQNFVPMASYTVKYATFSVASLAGDTTAWFNAAPSSATLAAAVPGSSVTLKLEGLFPLSTFYFAVKSADTFTEVSAIDARASAGLQAFAMPANFPPVAPSTITAQGGFRSANIAWADLTPAQKGLVFAGYRLFRSTDPVNAFVQIATTTATTWLDKPIRAYTTFYYKVDATQGAGGYGGLFTPAVPAAAFTEAPQDPFGFVVTPASSTVSFRWNPTVRFADGTPFSSSTAPVADELIGYSILRSTNICTPSYTWLSSATVNVTSFTDVTNGNSYFYQIHGFNTLALSTSTLVISTLGDQHYKLDDCLSEVVIDNQTASVLNKSSNTLGGDILISRARRPQDVGDDVVQSVEFIPMLNGVEQLRGFALPKPARIVLHYQTAGGVPVGDARPLGLSAAALANAQPTGTGLQGLNPENLGAYWNNGTSFKKMYGKVDTLSQTVTVESPNLGVYQVRAMLRSDSAVFDLSNMSGRVITPNGDGKNDQVIFTYDPGPRNVVPEGKIYDMHGAFVADMRPGLVPNTLVWDGFMNGRAVTSGVYVYRITGDGKAFSGTIVVAR